MQRSLVAECLMDPPALFPEPVAIVHVDSAALEAEPDGQDSCHRRIVIYSSGTLHVDVKDHIGTVRVYRTLLLQQLLRRTKRIYDEHRRLEYPGIHHIA